MAIPQAEQRPLKEPETGNDKSHKGGKPSTVRVASRVGRAGSKACAQDIAFPNRKHQQKS